ncbi:MAG: rhomboid family intramembrane serine protease [Deltaproteobacteria bacterium]|nr:rhomboid family intramembrane serine protease [Deltaproteobacteria bacterium]
MHYSERKSILCPNCRKLINRDESFCPYCGISRPGSSWKRISPARLIQNPYDIIKILIYSNVAIYIFSLLLSPTSLGLSANPLTFLSPSNRSLFMLGATGTIPIERFHWWWTLLSASYLHGGILHILFNMLALKQIGPFIVREYGLSRFFSIYTLTGIAGFYISYLAGIPFTIGASASICGLIGATLYYGKSRGDFYGHIIYKQVMGWVIGIAIFGFLIPGINNWGHGGGIIAGIILGFLLGYSDRKPEQHLHRVLAILCFLFTALVLLWAVIQSIYYSFLAVPH